MQDHLGIKDILARLEARGYGVKRSGDVYRSQCPAHGGKDFNLAFTEGNKGQVVFTCHSHQCTYEEIMASLGFEKETPIKKKSAPGGRTIHSTFAKAVSAAAYGVKANREPDAIYGYKNLDGSENFSMVRWNMPNGKETRPISKVDGGYFVGANSDGGYPIYRLPEIAKHLKSCGHVARIFICEGEKATEAAASVGF